MSKRNPDSSSILQALLDCADSGYGNLTIDQLITKMSNESRIRVALQEKWNGHAYPEKSLTWTQYTIDQHAFHLSDTAFKVLSLLGMYCHQNGLIRIRKQDIMAVLGISEPTVRRALTELSACGAICIKFPAVRHTAPVYSVNPALLNKGTRRKTDITAFTAGLEIDANKYLFNQELRLQARVETIYSSETPAYNNFTLVPPEQKKGPAVATTADPGSDKSVNPRPHHRTRAQKPSSAEQMSIYDWLGEVDS